MSEIAPVNNKKLARSGHNEAKHLFDACVELPAAKRDEVIQASTASGAAKQEVRDLLAMHDLHQGHVRPDTPDPLARSVNAVISLMSDPPIKLGDRVGPWRIVASLGMGGMGAVYKAEREDAQFTQIAALKVLSGLPTNASHAFLARERQILASLSHPNIARIIDGGDTPEGSPYLAMDYVEGKEIDQYCREKRLSFSEMVGLFRAVCRTLAYAHQRLVLHCDLKPSNVMVDADGRPVVLDFGISRFVDAVRDANNDARAGMPVNMAAAFTPNYASPEQQRGLPLSTASDIFGAGKLLEALARITGIPSAMQRDVTAVIACATHHDVAQRYTSILHMEADLGALLENKPLDARRSDRLYVWGKLLRRRWGAFAVGLAFLALSTVFTVNLTIQRNRAVAAEKQTRDEFLRATRAESTASIERDRAQVAELRERERAKTAQYEAGRANAERDRANLERDRARQAQTIAKRETERAIRMELQAQSEAGKALEVRDFLLGLFDNMRSGPVSARKISAYDLLEQGRLDAEKRLMNQPVLRSEILQALAKIYENIGDLGNAIKLYATIVSLERAPDTGRPANLAFALSRQALAESNSANHAVAETLARESLDIRVRAFGANSLEVADSHSSLGLALSGLRRHAESRQHLESALSIRERLLPPDDEALAAALHNLGQNFAVASEWDKAIALYRRAIDIKSAKSGPRHPITLSSVEGLGWTLWRAYRLAEAESVFAQLYQGQVEVHGTESERVASAAYAWGNVLYDLGRYRDARKRLQEATDLLGRAPLQERPLRFALHAFDLGLLVAEMEDWSEAEAVFRQVLVVRERLLPAENQQIAQAKAWLAQVLIRQGKIATAEPLCLQALRLREKTATERPGDLFDSQLVYIDLLLEKQLLVEADAKYREISASGITNTRRRVNWLAMGARLSLTHGDLADAVSRTKERVEITRKREGGNHPRTAVASIDLAEYLMLQGERAAASKLLGGLALPILQLAPQGPSNRKLARLQSPGDDASRPR